MLREKIKKNFFKCVILLVFCGILQLNNSCQRDDICPATTQTTPLLRIAFVDFEDPEIPKPPVNLRVKAADYDSIFLNRVNVAEISIPLRPNMDFTEYEFILNAPLIPAEGEDEPEDNSNTDRISFAYSPNEEYINRACSYRVSYQNLSATISGDNDRWISTILVEESNIENETDIHIYIYH